VHARHTLGDKPNSGNDATDYHTVEIAAGGDATFPGCIDQVRN
jgi:hypothetical protein